MEGLFNLPPKKGRLSPDKTPQCRTPWQRVTTWRGSVRPTQLGLGSGGLPSPKTKRESRVALLARSIPVIASRFHPYKFLMPDQTPLVRLGVDAAFQKPMLRGDNLQLDSPSARDLDTFR